MEYCPFLIDFAFAILKFKSMGKNTKRFDSYTHLIVYLNNKRSSKFFAKVYANLYQQYAPFLLDSQNKPKRKLYIMDCTTITLFNNILKCAGRKPMRGKKKGGIKVHTIIPSDENVPKFIRFISAATNDHILLKDVDVPQGSIIVFDKGYVDYRAYERFSQQEITYVIKHSRRNC